MTLGQVNTLVAHRAKALKDVRHFFDTRGYLEVDTQALSPFAAIDTYIDPIVTTENLFLHTSPEYAMKKLLCEGSGSIYFLGHVFRKEEVGSLHNNEFTMIEWYKTETSKEKFLEEVCDLLFLFIGKKNIKKISYNDAWQRYASKPEIDTTGWQADEINHYIWATSVEPKFNKDEVTMIYDFPKEEAALAKTHFVDGVELAERFEFYYGGIELANGYHELSDPIEQMRRFEEINQKRSLQKKASLPIDKTLIKALEKGLPKNTYGIAVGFDRLFMLKHNLSHINQAQP